MAESRTPPQPVETILVVDDEVLVRVVIAQYLRDCGYRVIETSAGGAAAEEAVRRHTPDGILRLPPRPMCSGTADAHGPPRSRLC